MEIRELMEKTQTERRTIYYYIQLGLLQSPAGTRQKPQYTEAHAMRLRWIKERQSQRHTLREIKHEIDRGANCGTAVAEDLSSFKDKAIAYAPLEPTEQDRYQEFTDRREQEIRYLRVTLAQGLELHCTLPSTDDAIRWLRDKLPEYEHLITKEDGSK